MSATARVVSLARQYVRAPDELAARLVLQALALEVAKLEVAERLLSGLTPGASDSIELTVNRRAFEVAMDALSQERSGLKVTP
jgi:hypothetical protein